MADQTPKRIEFLVAPGPCIAGRPMPRWPSDKHKQVSCEVDDGNVVITSRHEVTLYPLAFCSVTFPLTAESEEDEAA